MCSPRRRPHFISTTNTARIIYLVSGPIAIIGLLVIGYLKVLDIDLTWLILAGILMFLSNTAIGLSRIQIRENGIWVYYNLISWDKIRSYEWIPAQGKTQALKYYMKRKRLLFFGLGIIPVPLEKKDQAQQLLDRYLPNEHEN